MIFARVVSALAITFTFSALAYSQNADKRIDDVDHLVTQANEAIAIADKEAPYSEIYVVEVSANKTGNSYPAVGTYSNVTRFHYTFGDREKDPYPNRLLRASVVTKRAASVTTSEFFYNPAGQLIYGVVATAGEGQRVMRMYFAAGQLIRLVDGDKDVNIRNRNVLETSAAFKRESARLTALFTAALKEGL